MCRSCSAKKVAAGRGNFFGHATGKLWSELEIAYLKKNYHNGEMVDLIKNTTHSYLGVQSKGRKLGLYRHRKFNDRPRNKYKFTTENNPMNDPNVRKQVSIKRKEYLNKNPDKVLNVILRRNHITSIEKVVMRLLNKHNISFKFNHYVKTKDSYKFPDFRVSNVIIECDGNNFHNDKEKETLRDKELIAAGFSLLHFSEDKINKNKEIVERCILKRLADFDLLSKNKILSYI